MTKTMQEYIKALTDLLSELGAESIMSKEFKAVIERDFKEWSEQERNDLLLLSAHVACWEADILARVGMEALTRQRAVINKHLRPLLKGANPFGIKDQREGGRPAGDGSSDKTPDS